MTIHGLHVVTDDDVLARAGFFPAAEAVLDTGGPATTFHLRGHRTHGGFLLEAGLRLAEVAQRAGARLLVNDRVDVALAAGADGVQIGRMGLPINRVRDLIGSRLLGYSAHGAEEGAAAARAGADFLLVGTIYETRAHPGGAMGPELVRACAKATDTAVIAIGGVTPGRVAEVVQAGARGVAVRGGVWDAPDPAAAVAEYIGVLAQSEASRTRMQPDEIEVTVNGEPRAVPAGMNVGDLLTLLGLHPGLVVVEHNREILERSRVAEVNVRAGDVFEIVHFVGGG